MWLVSILIAFGLYSILIIYTTSYNKSLSFLALTQAVAGTAGIMIGLSFALSGLNYFFNILKKRLAYRKYMGLVGFWSASLYSLSLLVLDPERYLFGFFFNILTPDFVLGLGAMMLLTFMAFISLDRFMLMIGRRRWRSLLRLGYLAYAMLVVRGIILEGDSWWLWLSSFQGLPPPRLVVSVFAVVVLLLRISMELSLALKRRPLAKIEVASPKSRFSKTISQTQSPRRTQRK